MRQTDRPGVRRSTHPAQARQDTVVIVKLIIYAATVWRHDPYYILDLVLYCTETQHNLPKVLLVLTQGFVPAFGVQSSQFGLSSVINLKSNHRFSLDTRPRVTGEGWAVLCLVTEHPRVTPHPFGYYRSQSTLFERDNRPQSLRLPVFFWRIRSWTETQECWLVKTEEEKKLSAAA